MIHVLLGLFILACLNSECNSINSNESIIITEKTDFILLQWASKIGDRYSLYVKEYGRSEYRSIFRHQRVSAYRFKRPDNCFEADFLVKNDDNNDTMIKEAHIGPRLPAAVKISNFSIIYQWYDEITGEITINLEWKNNITSVSNNWTKGEIQQNSLIHVMECGDGINAETPQMEFTSITQGQIVLPKPYAAALANSMQIHAKCILLITVTSPVKVCGRVVPIEERTETTEPGLNSVVVVLECQSMENLECRQNSMSQFNGMLPEHAPPVLIPRCDPENVTSQWMSKTKLKIEWNFFKSSPQSSAANFKQQQQQIKAYMIRYGKVYRKSINGNPITLDLFPTLDEVGRRQMNGNETSLTIDLDTHVDKLSNFDYKISICALFEGNSDNDINWAIVPMYNLQTLHRFS